MVAISPPRFNLALLAFALGAIALGLASRAILLDRARVVSAPAAQVSEAAGAKATAGSLRQTVLHLSRMLKGKSIGGFPGLAAEG